MTTTDTNAIEVLYDGRIYAALVEEQVFMPGGHAITQDAAEARGFDESEAGIDALSAACLEAATAYVDLRAAAPTTSTGDAGGRSSVRRGEVSRLAYDKAGKLIGHYVWR